MPIFWGDYLRDTAHLTTAENGAYLLLIGHYWTTGEALPDDDERLRRITRMEKAEWKKAKATVRSFFTPVSGKLTHKRIEAELKAAGERRAKNKDRATKAASSRWGSSKDAPSIAPGTHDALLEECPPPTQETPDLESESHNQQHVQQGIAPAGAGSGGGKSSYAFVGKVIRLNPKDYDRWRKLFPHLPLEAELANRDEWLAGPRATDDDRKTWFVSTQAQLTKLEREAVIKLSQKPEDRPLDYRVDPKTAGVPG